MYRTLLRRVERYSSPGTLGMGFQIPITNCSYSGLWRPLVWTAFSVTPAIRPACRLSSSLESRSVRLPSSMARSSDSHSPVLRTCPVMRFPRAVAGKLPITAIAEKWNAPPMLADQVDCYAGVVWPRVFRGFSSEKLSSNPPRREAVSETQHHQSRLRGHVC